MELTEVRAGIRKLAVRYVCPITLEPSTPYEYGFVRQLEAFGIVILGYLHSQGVAIIREEQNDKE